MDEFAEDETSFDNKLLVDVGVEFLDLKNPRKGIHLYFICAYVAVHPNTKQSSIKTRMSPVIIEKKISYNSYEICYFRNDL